MPSDPRAALREAVATLRAAGIDDPAGDARRLMAHAAGVAPGMLTALMPDRLPPGTLPAFAAMIARRAVRVPVAQITGLRSFYGRDFRVTADTLDPRPDTEALVAEALREPFARVLDLGTGTGCILLTLLAERPGATGLATDLSEAALDVARANAARLDLLPRAALLRADWWVGVEGRFDLIVSNPPYIALSEMPGLAPEVRDHEPQAALTDGTDGLSAYRVIAAGAGRFLMPGGRIIVEIGWRQGPDVAAILRGAGLSEVRILPDMEQRDRVVAARAP